MASGRFVVTGAAVAAIAVAALGLAGWPGARPSDAVQAADAVGSGYGPAAVLAGMSEAQRAGELFMAGTPAAGPLATAVQADVTNYHVGSIILTGRSGAGVTATRRLTSQLQSLATAAATGGVPLFIATD